ncbi:zona pellucida sperm-binding protein 3-like [Aulostomus maculatus]
MFEKAKVGKETPKDGRQEKDGSWTGGLSEEQPKKRKINERSGVKSGVGGHDPSSPAAFDLINPPPPPPPWPPSPPYRLRSYRLRKPAVSAEQKQTLRLLVEQRSEVKELTPELQEPRESVPKMLVRGPDLNPPVKQESKMVVKYEQRVPVPADSVAVRCGEGEVTVEVKQNFLGNGQLIHPGDLTLGGCAALDATDRVLRFKAELHGCSSRMRTSKDALIYTFSLMYSPEPIGDTSIFKTNPAEVLIECHYQRRHYVSSSAVMPAWKQFASSVLAEQQLRFSLRLMTEDWQSQRSSNVYVPNDMMYIEASVQQGHHVPLRVFVDSCVATETPDPNSEPRYPFISNHGCLSDGKLTGAKSYFMQRSQEDKLRFQLKAFRFHQDDRNSLYVTCHLKATTLSVPVDSRHKACSFLTEANRWVASGGDNQLCSCCESSCGGRRWRRSLAADADLQWEGTAALGPILLEDDTLRQEPTELSQLPPDHHRVTQAGTEPPRHFLLSAFNLNDGSDPLPAPLLAATYGAGAALAGVLLVFVGAVVYSSLDKPTDKTRT